MQARIPIWLTKCPLGMVTWPGGAIGYSCPGVGQAEVQENCDCKLMGQ